MPPRGLPGAHGSGGTAGRGAGIFRNKFLTLRVMEQSLKEKTARGILWGAVNNGGQQLLNLVFGICLGRMLDSSDYGMVGMLAIFALIASSLQESGFISALNRKRDATAADFNAVFWFNVLCSSSIYIVLFFAAPLIAAWFKEPELVPLGRLSFLSFVFSSLGTAPRAYLFRNLQVKETAWISLTALAASGLTGIVLAWRGFAYWGLAIQNLVYCFLMTALTWYRSGWRPSARVDLRPLRGMLGFSSKLLITNIFTHINNNLFSVFFGRLYGKQMVGYYNQANKWTYLGCNLLNGTLWSVTQPVFARLSDDRERERRAFRKMLRFTAFVSCPALFGLALVAPEFITILITDKWLPSARIMQILCAGGAFVPIATFYSNFLISQGRSNVFMWNTVGLCLLQTGALVALYPFGVRTMVCVYVALNVLWLPVWHWFVQRLLGLSLWTAVRDVAPFVLISAGCIGLGYAAALPFDSVYVRFAVKVVVTALAYVGLMKGLRVVVFLECIDFLGQRFRRRQS